MSVEKALRELERLMHLEDGAFTKRLLEDLTQKTNEATKARAQHETAVSPTTALLESFRSMATKLYKNAEILRHHVNNVEQDVWESLDQDQEENLAWILRVLRLEHNEVNDVVHTLHDVYLKSTSRAKNKAEQTGT